MPYGLDKGELVLQEFTIKIGTIANPETIGTDNIDPRTKFTGDQLSFLNQGTTTVSMPREYAEALNSTPAQLIRKDITRQQMLLNTEVLQFNHDLLKLIMNAETQQSYAITTPSAQVQDIIHVGTSQAGQCTGQNTFAFLLEAERTDCVPIYVMIYEAIVTPDTVDFAADGASYVSTAAQFEATPVTAITDNAKNLGMVGIVTG